MNFGPNNPMAKNIYGPPMAKNIYGSPKAKNTFSSHYSQSDWGDKQKIHENPDKKITNLKKREQSSAHA